jgi:DNA segregation ATPase FtsK/SpoIIIE-like protein
MLLGEAGAERLLGRGDLLFKAIGGPERLQSVYLSEEERDRLLSDAGAPAAAQATRSPPT